VTTLRFFAAARAAAGMDDLRVDGAATLAAALDRVEATDAAAWERVRARSSFLVDGVTTRDPGTPLTGVTLVDVMPPFAGG
jgi:sulfur-carrier protein